MATPDAYFNYGPVDEGGKYSKSRGALDGVLGFFDGVSSVANSLDRTSGSIARASQNFADAGYAFDDRRLKREERETEMQMDRFKVYRGDNNVTTWALAAGAVALVVVFAR